MIKAYCPHCGKELKVNLELSESGKVIHTIDVTTFKFRIDKNNKVVKYAYITAPNYKEAYETACESFPDFVVSNEDMTEEDNKRLYGLLPKDTKTSRQNGGEL